MANYFSNENRKYNQLLGEIDSIYHSVNFKLNISDSAMRILYAICESGDECQLKDICLKSGLSKQTINSSIRNLERENIVYLTQSEKKGKKVHLTTKGKEITENTALRLITIENEILDAWSEEDVKTYLFLTEKYLNDFKKKVKELH